VAERDAKRAAEAGNPHCQPKKSCGKRYIRCNQLKLREHAGFQNISEREFPLEEFGFAVLPICLMTFFSFTMFDGLSVYSCLRLFSAIMCLYNRVPLQSCHRHHHINKGTVPRGYCS
jgi:hypothetical protein